MGGSCTIGGVTFGEPSNAAGNYLENMDVQDGQTRIVRFNPFGANGNVKILGGHVGQSIMVEVLYVGSSYSNCVQRYRSHREAWEDGDDVQITTDSGKTYKRCTLESARRQKPRASGRGDGRVFMDAVFFFNVDGVV